MDVSTATRRWNALNAGLLACCIGLFYQMLTIFQTGYAASRICHLTVYDQTTTRWIASLLVTVGVCCVFRGMMALKVAYGYSSPEEVRLVHARIMPIILIASIALMTGVCMIQCVTSSM